MRYCFTLPYFQDTVRWIYADNSTAGGVYAAHTNNTKSSTAPGLHGSRRGLNVFWEGIGGGDKHDPGDGGEETEEEGADQRGREGKVLLD